MPYRKAAEVRTTRIALSQASQHMVDSLDVELFCNSRDTRNWELAGNWAISEISSTVRDFVRKHISSVHQLELLLLLKRYNDRAWTASELARELYTSPTAVEQNLQSFTSTRLAKQEPGENNAVPTYRYLCDECDDQVNELVEAYKHYRVRVIDAIFSASNDTLKDFSDAFRLKRPEGDK